MKRLIGIICCLFQIFASGAAAWASCKQTPLTFPDQGHAPSTSAHDHHSDSNHEHSDPSRVHCPTIEGFVPTVVLSAKTGAGQERILNPFTAELIFRMSYGEFHPLTHGPPVNPRSNGIPSHLFLSVLRI